MESGSYLGREGKGEGVGESERVREMDVGKICLRERHEGV